MPDAQEQRRLPHAALDPASRLAKARKIRTILQQHMDLRGCAILDIGTGSGHIAASLAEAAGPDGEVWGVDAVDQRQVEAATRFALVTDARLPFEDASFDVVVSNHVVEHVGGLEDQQRHLGEIARVLRPGGIGYLATPNRWAVIEPHYHLPFLSWLPRWARGGYVRLARRGWGYDCDPLARGVLVRLLRRAPLRFRDATEEAMHVMASVESPGRLRRAALRAPRWMIASARPIVPALIYLVRNG